MYGVLVRGRDRASHTIVKSLMRVDVVQVTIEKGREKERRVE
jgi:hypothetical protein